MVQKADPAAIGQVTAKVKAVASHGRPVIPPADLAAIRKAALAADRQAVLSVTQLPDLPHRLGSVSAYRMTMVPEAIRLHGIHSAGRTTRVPTCMVCGG